MNINKKAPDGLGAFFWAYIWLKKDALCYKSNVEFLERMNIPRKDTIYISSITSTVIARINMDMVEEFSKDECFIGWSPYDFEVPRKSEVDAIISQINAMLSENDSASKTLGNGVKIGVISAENNTFDKSALSLSGVEITTLPSPLPPKVSRHPTAVLSEIVGRRVSVDGVVLFGLARGASVYFYSAKTTKNVYTAIEEMVEAGVRVINYSAGIQTNGYSPFDMQIDRLVEAGNFLFVCSSGNDGTLTSPAKAENALACGNIVTKDYPNTPLPPPWSVWCSAVDSCSGYGDTHTLVHKPDVVAPGAFVGYADRVGANFESFGTSFACPWVSGIATLVIAETEGKYTYLTIKGMILLSSSNDRVNKENNPQISDFILEKSGWGMVDLARALEIAKSAVVYEGVLSDELDVDLPPLWNELIFIYEKSGDEPIITLSGERYEMLGQNALIIKKGSKENNSPLSIIGTGNTRFSVVVN